MKNGVKDKTMNMQRIMADILQDEKRQPLVLENHNPGWSSGFWFCVDDVIISSMVGRNFVHEERYTHKNREVPTHFWYDCETTEVAVWVRSKPHDPTIWACNVPQDALINMIILAQHGHSAKSILEWAEKNAGLKVCWNG